MPARALRATRESHQVRDIPRDSTLDVRAKVTAGTVQGHAVFVSDAIHQWTYAELRQGVQATIDGLSWLRILSVLQPGAKVRIDATITDGGEVIRHRFWELEGGANGATLPSGWFFETTGGAG